MTTKIEWVMIALLFELQEKDNDLKESASMKRAHPRLNFNRYGKPYENWKNFHILLKKGGLWGGFFAAKHYCHNCYRYTDDADADSSIANDCGCIQLVL